MLARYLLDCSFIFACLVEEKYTAWARSVLADVLRHECWVPGLWSLELVSAIRSAERRKRISAAEADEALRSAQLLKLSWDHEIHPVTRIDRWSHEHGLTPYDAVYLELSQRRNLTLVSLDAALVRAARKHNLPVLSAV